MKPFLTLGELGRVAGVSRQNLWELRVKRNLPVIRVDGEWLVSRAVAEGYLREHEARLAQQEKRAQRRVTA